FNNGALFDTVLVGLTETGPNTGVFRIDTGPPASTSDGLAVVGGVQIGSFVSGVRQGIPTVFAAAGSANGGILQVRADGVDANNFITAEFNDPEVKEGPNAVLRVTFPVTVQKGTDSVVTLTPANLTPNSILSVSVLDTDTVANQHLGPGNDTVTVTLTSFS